jgi:hypothetical protein
MIRSAACTVLSRCAMTRRGIDLGKSRGDGGLRAIVEGAGRFVEEQDAGAMNESPGNHQPLPLAAGQRADAAS